MPPPFLPGYSDPQMPPPYEFSGVNIRSFPLRARRDAVQRVIDTYLNVAPPGSVDFEFRTVGSPGAPLAHLYMMVLHYDRMVSLVPHYHEMGYLTQHELYFALPVVRWVNGSPAEVGLFTPYIFVDNTWSLVCGNTVVGYPKQMAWFRMPASVTTPYPIQADAPVFPRYSPDTLLSWHRLVEVSSLVGDIGERSGSLWPFGDVEALFVRDVEVPVEKAVLDLLKGAAGVSYKVYQLKQIRDSEGFAFACYQGILSFTAELATSPVATWGPLPPAVIDLKRYESLPIGEKLGLVYGADGRLYSVFPYWIRCGFSVKDSQVLYSAT